MASRDLCCQLCWKMYLSVMTKSISPPQHLSFPISLLSPDTPIGSLRKEYLLCYLSSASILSPVPYTVTSVQDAAVMEAREAGDTGGMLLLPSQVSLRITGVKRLLIIGKKPSKVDN